MNRFLLIIFFQLFILSGAHADSLCTEGFIKYRLGVAHSVDALIKIRILFAKHEFKPLSLTKEIQNPHDEFTFEENGIKYPVWSIFPQWLEYPQIQLIESSKTDSEISKNTLQFEPRISIGPKWLLSLTYLDLKSQSPKNSQTLLHNIKKIEISRVTDSPENQVIFHQKLENLRICDQY